MKLFSSNTRVGGSENAKKQVIDVKKIINAIKPIYILTVALIGTSLYSGYELYSQNLDIESKKASAESMEQEWMSNQDTLKAKNREVTEFNAKIAKINKNFIPVRTDFGVYKFILEMDDLKKKYPFDYKIDDKEKSLTKVYKFYTLTFVIDYENIDKFKEVMKILTKDYYMGFLGGEYSEGKFVMKYDLYAYDTKAKI